MRLVWSIVCLSVAQFICGGGIAQTATLPVPRAVIYPGDLIRPEMLTERAFRRNTRFEGHFITSKEALSGKMARRTLLPGRPIPRLGIREPYLIRQGETRATVYQSSGLTISGRTVALESGSAGETISTRNPDSGITVRAIVQADGSLRVGAQ